MAEPVAASIDSDLRPVDLAAALSDRIRGIGTSQIGLVADRGRDDPEVVKLWIGEGDLPTPPFIVEAAHRAMLAGHTRYTDLARPAGPAGGARRLPRPALGGGDPGRPVRASRPAA